MEDFADIGRLEIHVRRDLRHQHACDIPEVCWLVEFHGETPLMIMVRITRRLLIALSGTLVALVLLSAVASADCVSGIYHQGQWSTYSHQFTGTETYIKVNSFYSIGSNESVAEWIDVDAKPQGWYTCANATSSNPNGYCWEQVGFEYGKAGSASDYIHTTYPEVFWETSNMWGYDISAVYGAPPLTSPFAPRMFFNVVRSNTTDGHGHPYWDTYYTLASPYNPVHLGSSPMYWDTMPTRIDTEEHSDGYPTCPESGLISFGSDSSNQPSTTYGMKNTSNFPPTNWSLWTSDVQTQFDGPSGSGPYYRNNYGYANWFLQTSGGG